MLRQLSKKVIRCQVFTQNTHRLQSVQSGWHQLRSSSTAATFAKEASPTLSPTIADVLVDMTFVDPKGARRKVKGMVGTLSSIF
jgi:hypothetical protein